MEDTFEGLEDEDLEDEAGKEVDKVLFEITNGEGSRWASTLSSVCVHSNGVCARYFPSH